MSGFTKGWIGKEEQRGLASRIKQAIRSEGPLRERIETTARTLQLNIMKLEAMSSKLAQKDAAIFQRIVEAQRRGNVKRASMLANELAEVRRMNKMLTQARLAIEQIKIRMETIKELGDVATMLAPAASVISNVRASLADVVPAAEKSMGDINSMLNSILVDAGQVGGLTLNFSAANADAEKILAEASVVAEQKIKESLPELPSTSIEVAKAY